MRFLAAALLSLTLLAAPTAQAQISLLGVTNSLVQFVLERISTPDSFEITAEGVEQPGDGLTELVGVRVADARGVWLEIDAVGLDWNVRRILLGELDIRRLTARGVNVLRRPEPASLDMETTAETEPSSEPFAWPRAPISTRVEALSLTNVRIAEGVLAGQSLAFDATGSAFDEGDTQGASLDLARTDGTAGQIDLAYLRDFAQSTLNLDINAREGPGGVVAELAGFPPDTGSSIALQASGPLSDWAVNFDAGAERLFQATGDGAIALGPPFALDVGVTVSPGPALDPQIAAAIGESATLVARAREDGAGLVVIEEGRISAPDIALNVAGRFDRGDSSLDGTVTLDVGGGLSALLEGVTWANLGFDGTVRGTLDDLEAAGVLALDGLATAPVDIASATLDATITRNGPRFGALLSGAAEGLRLDRIGPDLLGRPELRVDGSFEDNVVTLDQLAIVAPLLTVEAEGAADLAADTANLAYALATPDLGAIAAAYDLDAGGRIAVDGRLEGALSAPRLVGQAALETITWQGEGYGRATLDHDVTLGATPEGTLTLTSQGSVIGPASIDAAFRLEQPVLTLRDLDADILGTLTQGAVTLNLENLLAEGEIATRIADLDALAAFAGAPVTGAAEGTLVLSAPDNTQSVDLDMTASGITGPGTALVSARIDASLTDVRGAPGFDGTLLIDGLEAAGARVGRLVLEGTAADLLGTPSVEATLDAADIASAGLSLGAVSGRAQVAGLTGLPVGTADLTLSDLAAGGALVADATARLALSDIDGALRAMLEAEAPMIVLDGGRLGPLTLMATAEDALGDDPALDAEAKLVGGTVGGARLDQVALTANGRRSDLAITADLGGAVEEAPVAASLRAAVNASDPAAIIARLTRGSASYDTLEAELLQPATLRFGDESAVDDLALSIPGGTLRAAARRAGSGTIGSLDLSLSDVLPLVEFAGLPVASGALALSASLDTTGQTPRADATLNAINIALADALLDDAGFDIDGTLRWRGGRATAEAEATGPFGAPLQLALSVPLQDNNGGLPSVPQGGRLEGSLAWQGRIGDLWLLVPAPDHVLDGDVVADLVIGGTVARPTVGGDLALSDGRYENLLLGTILTELTVTSTIAPDGGFEIDATASDGSNGRVDAQALIGNGEVRARVDADSAILVRRDDVQAAISLDIRAEGSLVSPAISGRVGIDRAEVNLAASLPPSVADIGPFRIRGVEPEPEEPGAGADIPLDITIEGERDIFVRGRGLDSEWRVDMQVGGTAAAPEVVGVVERVRGALNLVGFTFQLEVGEIRFTGSTPIDPVLDIQILRENEGVIGGIYVDGTGSDPNVEFRSTPSLPEDEVLPRVLFGQSQQSLTGAQALLIAGGVAELMGGSGLLSGLRDATGIDVLRLDDDGEGGADVTVGSNVADNVFVGAKQPLDGGPARITVEIEVFDNVIVDTEVSGDDQSLGLSWRREF